MKGTHPDPAEGDPADVAAWGLVVEQLTHVVNYQLRSAPEAYVHRIGRVGRAHVRANTRQPGSKPTGLFRLQQ